MMSALPLPPVAKRLALTAMLGLGLSGCIARAAADVITAPVRAGAQVADWATTSQDEADRARGRELRHREEELGRLSRARELASRKCYHGDQNACRVAESINDQMEVLRDSPTPD